MTEAAEAPAPDPVEIELPEPSLVVLVGPSGGGKSTFARRHFRATEVLSSDAFRAMVADSEADQGATADAFDVLHLVADRRLRAGRLTVVDATSVQPEARARLVEIARGTGVPAIAIVFDLPEAVCAERNLARPDRQVPPHVIPLQLARLRASLEGLGAEGFREVFILRGVRQADAARVRRVRATSTSATKMNQPEVWLRGPVEGVPPVLMPAAHALLGALEDLARVAGELTPEELWARPGGAAAVGFHLRHVAGSTDRLLTYARGEALDERQRAALASEGEPRGDAAELVAELRASVEAALAALRATPAERVLDARAVGRAGLPSTVLGLLFHAAEHAQRHTGQAIATAKAARAAAA